MKIKRIILTILILILIAFVALSIYLTTNGKDFIIIQLGEVFQRSVSFEEISFTLPFNLLIKDINIEGYLKAEEANIRVGLLELLKREISFPVIALKEPEITIQRDPQKRLIFGTIAPPSKQETKPAELRSKVPSKSAKDQTAQSLQEADLSLVIKRLKIDKGKVIFLDKSQEDQKVYIIKDINLTMRQFAYPFKSLRTHFEFDAFLADKDNNAFGQINGLGWINPFKKDMQADLKVENLKGVETSLAPEFLSNVKGMTMDLTAHVTARNNDMTVDGNFHLKKDEDFSAKETTKDLSWEDYAIEAISSSGIKISTNFKFETKMDEFKIEGISFTGEILQNQ